MMRLVNIMVIAALIVAASTVYKIKFNSTLQAEKAAKLHSELRRERNAIARLRAEWARTRHAEPYQDAGRSLSDACADQSDADRQFQRSAATAAGPTAAAERSDRRHARAQRTPNHRQCAGDAAVTR